MGHQHDHLGADCDCVAFRLINYCAGSMPSRSLDEALCMALGVVQGLRAAMLHPEWAQAVIQEDDERLGANEAGLYKWRAEELVGGLPIIATTEPPEPTT